MIVHVASRSISRRMHEKRGREYQPSFYRRPDWRPATNTHAEPQLSLAAPTFTPAFEKDFETAYGAGLTRALEELPTSATRDAVKDGRLADLIGEANPDYMEGCAAVHSQAEANQLLEAVLSHLEPGRRAELAGMIRFAAHKEVKHVAARRRSSRKAKPATYAPAWA